MPPRAAPRSTKTASPLGQGGTSGGFWGRHRQPGALFIRKPTPALRATPPRKGIFKGSAVSFLLLRMKPGPVGETDGS
jgi:hypothetical protein